jgi:hypothetical protein
MPDIQSTTDGNMAIYSESESHPPILRAVLNGDLKTLETELNSFSLTVDKKNITDPSKLYMSGKCPTYGYSIASNLAQLAVLNDQYETFEYIVNHADSMGFTPDDFIGSVNYILKDIPTDKGKYQSLIESKPEIIQAHRKEMGSRGYPAFDGEEPPASTATP